MKIAIDAREMAGVLAGKGRYITELVKALAVIDHDNQYYLYSKEPIPVELPANFEKVKIGGLPGLRQLWLTLDAKHKRADLLFAPTGYLPIILSLIPTIMTVHDLALFITADARPSFKTLLAERLLLGLAVKKASRVITVSQSTKRDLHKIFRVPIKKVDVTLLGYDAERYTPVATIEDAEILTTYSLQATNYLLFIGTLEPRKNIVGLITAYGALPEGLRKTYPLVIAGQKGWFYDEIFETVKKLKLVESVRFLGRIPDAHIATLYRQARLFAFPSFYEGFGLPALEALASGTPVITSNLSSLPEVVDKGGLLIDPNDTDSISSALTTLLTDEATYQKLKNETIDQAKQFSWSVTATETLDSFMKVRK